MHPAKKPAAIIKIKSDPGLSYMAAPDLICKTIEAGRQRSSGIKAWICMEMGGFCNAFSDRYDIIERE